MSLDGVDLSVRVLTMGYWPTQSTTAPYVVPPVAQSTFDVFCKFYLRQYSERQLTLQTHMVRIMHVHVHAYVYMHVDDSYGTYMYICVHVHMYAQY